MTCTDFADCISNPLDVVGAPAAGWTLSNVAHFSINLIFYLLYASLFVWIVYNLVRTIYILMFSDTQDMYEKFRQGLTNAAFAAFGMVLIKSARFIPTEVLRLLGVSENIFRNLPF